MGAAGGMKMGPEIPRIFQTIFPLHNSKSD
jgi:hypothetical protein